MAIARRDGPFIAWRDADGTLRIHTLGADDPVTVGRAITHTVAFAVKEVSRDHVELVRRVFGEPDEESVQILDLKSRAGTEHRRVTMRSAAEVEAGPLRPVPVAPGRPLQLSPGDHDVLLAGRVWLRVGGVRIDRGLTAAEAEQIPAPTKREREVLVELCREQFARGTTVATPSNAVIGARLEPSISGASVSEIMGRMYVKYKLRGTKEQNRIELANLALARGLVGPRDYY